MVGKDGVRIIICYVMLILYSVFWFPVAKLNITVKRCVNVYIYIERV